MAEIIYPNKTILKPRLAPLGPIDIARNCARLGLPIPLAFFPCNSFLDVKSGAIGTPTGVAFDSGGIFVDSSTIGAGVSFPHNEIFNTSNISVFYVGYISSPESIKYKGLVIKRPTGGTGPWALTGAETADGAAPSKFLFYVRNTAPANLNAVSNSAYAAGQLYVVIGKCYNNEISMFVNGVKQSTTATFTGTLQTNTSVQRIGGNRTTEPEGCGAVMLAAGIWPGLSDAEARTLSLQWINILEPTPISIFFDFGAGPSNQNIYEIVDKGSIYLFGQEENDVRRYIRTIDNGLLNLNNLDPIDNISLRTRLVEEITLGLLELNGADILNVSSVTGAQNYIESIVKGVITLNGEDILNIPSIRTRLSEVLSLGNININGLTIEELRAVLQNLYEPINIGILNLNGLSLNEVQNVFSLGKSAASKLGLGDYGKIDIWATPFSDYIAKFDKKISEELRDRENIEEEVYKELANFELLNLQYKELESHLLKTADELYRAKLKSELRNIKREEKIIEKKLSHLKFKLLQEEDEELLILLNL